MKSAKWEQSSEVSIMSEVFNLKEVEANLSGLLTDEESKTGRITLALSFIHQAVQQLLQIKPQADLET